MACPNQRRRYSGGLIGDQTYSPPFKATLTRLNASRQSETSKHAYRTCLLPALQLWLAPWSHVVQMLHVGFMANKYICQSVDKDSG